MTYDENSPWLWRKATLQDCAAIAKSAYDEIRHEIQEVFEPSQETTQYNLINDVVKQMYNPSQAFVIVAEDKNTKQILAYSWAIADAAIWSNDAMLSIRLAQLSPNLSTRKRITLLSQMIDLWETYCLTYNIPVIASSSVRSQQQGFLKLHERKGFTVRGSIAYKKINSK